MQADTVELTNGIIVAGEILEDVAGKPLVFRHKVGDDWITTKVDRNRIERCRSEPGDQADGHAALGTNDVNESANGLVATTAAPGIKPLPDSRIPTPDDIKRLLGGLLPPPPPGGGEVAILFLVGPFKEANLLDIGDIVSYVDLSVMLDVAKARKPAAIVLAIDSPGGLVSEMNQIIDLITAEQSPPKSRRMVAWVDLGGSAAALTALSCKEIVAFPTARIGSATQTIDGEKVPEPRTALDQKIRALDDARRRQVASLTGRPRELQEAMEFPEKKLWFNEAKGFSLTEPAGEGWAALDEDENRPLALAADELVRCGVAKGVAGDVKSLLKLLDLPDDTPFVRIDLKDERLQDLIAPAREAVRKQFDALGEVEGAYRKRLQTFWDQLVMARRAADKIDRKTAGFNAADLDALKTALSRCRPPTMSAETRAQLQSLAPHRLNRYEECMDAARAKVARAKNSAPMHADTIPIGAILQDIRMAMEWVHLALTGEPLPDAK